MNPRYYIDGSPAEVLSVAPNGFITVIYDEANFKDYIQVGEAHDWQPCDESKVELQDETAKAILAKMGLKG